MSVGFSHLRMTSEVVDFSQTCERTELYLIHFIPLGVQILFDGLALEMAVADSERGVRVRFALD